MSECSDDQLGWHTGNRDGPACSTICACLNRLYTMNVQAKVLLGCWAGFLQVLQAGNVQLDKLAGFILGIQNGDSILKRPHRPRTENNSLKIESVFTCTGRNVLKPYRPQNCIMPDWAPYFSARLVSAVSEPFFPISASIWESRSLSLEERFSRLAAKLQNFVYSCGCRQEESLCLQLLGQCDVPWNMRGF